MQLPVVHKKTQDQFLLQQWMNKTKIHPQFILEWVKNPHLQTQIYYRKVNSLGNNAFVRK